MAEVLSQSEIDALLSAVSTGGVETAPPGADSSSSGGGSSRSSSSGSSDRSDYVAYDLTSQEKITKGRFVALQGIHERFARNFRVTLSNDLKKSVTVNSTNIDYMRFGDYLSNILLPASINIFVMTELKGYMLMVMSSKLAYAFVDAYYGGTERPFSKIGGREEFTNIETNIIQKVAKLTEKDLKTAWKLNYPMELEYLRQESNPNFVGVIHGSELVAVVNCEVEFENLSGSFVLIIQLRALENIQRELSVNVTGELSADEEQWKDHWLRELSTMEFEVKAELGHMEKKLSEVQTWKKGDVLLLEQDAVAPLDVYVEGVRKVRGTMGNYRGSRAVKLSQEWELPPGTKKKA